MKIQSTDAEFMRFAKAATAGIDSSGLMLGLFNSGGKGSRQWYAFALQIGVCLLQGKPLLLVVPHGEPIPDKLRAAATVVEFYTAGDQESCKLATKRALLAVGLPVRH